MQPCPICQYDLPASPGGTCSECGATEAARRQHVTRRNRGLRDNWWRLPALAVGSVVGAQLLFVFVFMGALLPNVGLPFGYYGEMNRAPRELESIAGAVVTSRGANYDVTLEEFGFDILLPSGTTVSVSVPDDTDYSSASHVVVRSADQLNLGSMPPYPGYSGLAFPLGTSLVSILGMTPLSVAEVVSRADAIAAYVDANSIQKLRKLHEPPTVPQGAAILQITRRGMKSSRQGATSSSQED